MQTGRAFPLFFDLDKKITAASAFRVSLVFWLIYSFVYLVLKGENVDYFGFENGNIAASVARGEGFADVMATGKQQPTAWMPLLYVYLLAGVFYLTGIKSTAALWMLSLIRCVVLAGGGYLAFKIGERFGRLQAVVCTLSFIGYMTGFSYIMVSNIFTEEWLMAVLLLLLVHQFILLFFNEHVSETYAAIVAALCALSSPILLAVWLGLFVIYVATGTLNHLLPQNWRAISHTTIAWKPTLVAIAAIVVIFFAWGIRNHYAMGKFIPLKSNMWMEVYLSNVMSQDGLLWKDVLHGNHPLTNQAARAAYMAQGEVDFLKAKEMAAKQYLADHPTDYLRKVARRFINAFGYTDMNQQATDWSEVSLKQHIRSLMVAFIPLLALLINLFTYRLQKPALTVMALVYVGCIMPYVLISHFSRYQFFAMGLQAVFVGLAFCIFVHRIQTGRFFPALISRKSL
ncbi:hypothetical protein [Rhodoflexus caldus]|uniref:hypothetical protein n=1 Tax=Rhodoflexus caldus TaxID=2891236 RepID=UPI00202A36B5|nr:hypothetical protein [Rhodoflexus caldus]